MQPLRARLLVSAASALLLIGCATSSQQYTPPQVAAFDNVRQVPQPFDVTWDRLVRQLSSDFFVINNIDKNSRLINLSFSSQRPSDYVDCGRTLRTFKNARGEQTYDYKAADSSAFTSTTRDGVAYNLRRTTRLDGRANIYVAPEAGGTVVSVNTKYVVNVQLQAFGFDGRPAGSETVVWDFSTKQPQTGEVQCAATGVIERRILSLLD